MTDQLPVKQQEAHAIVARLIATGKQIDIDLPATLDEQKAWALEKYDEHLKSGLQLGYALIVIKRQLETGEFLGWLEANNINPRTAQNYMKVAGFIAKMDTNTQRVAYLENPNMDTNTQRVAYLENPNMDTNTQRVAYLENPNMDTNTQRVAYLENPNMDTNTQRVAYLENPNIDLDIEVDQEIDAILARVIELPLRKQIELTKETPERIRAYFEGGLFDEIDDLNPTQIRTIIRQQKELESAKARSNRDEVHIKELRDENQRLKSMPEERRMIEAMRRQLFADMEAAQGIITRARKTFEFSKNFSGDVAHDAIEAVVHPLIHMMSVLHGGAKLIADDCYYRWEIDPTIPVNPPMPNTLTHEEKWLAEESARFQASITDSYLPKPEKKKGKK